LVLWAKDAETVILGTLCVYDRDDATKRRSLPDQERILSYVRVSILGSAPGGEVWSINPVFDPTFEFGTTVDQTKLDQAANDIAGLSPGSSLLSFLSNSLAITGARVEVRDDSTDALMAISIQVRPTPLAGTGTPLRGAATAMVCSLRTNTPGGSGRGRLYWPAIGTAVTTQLRFDSATQAGALTNFGTYFHAMEDALATAFPTVGFDLAVRSRTTHTTPHVNKIQVGNVPDTQRRRRDKQIEDYLSAAF
jgi:hypothetical protein